MLSFKDWFAQESSAATRARKAAFLGLGPKIASPFGHSTPPPYMVDKLLSDLDDDDDKPKKKKKKKKKDESHVKAPDYSFDIFFKKLQQVSKDIEKDIKDGDEADKDLDKKEKEKKKLEPKDKLISKEKPEEKDIIGKKKSIDNQEEED